ncbi:MAG: FAD-binding oxidoreductase [Verrucomicrobiota bacterium]
MHEDALRELQQILPPDRLQTGEEARYRASMDNLRFSRLPSAVLRPQDEDEVGAILRLANAHQVPLTTRGAGSATTGAATPTADGWVLDLSGWTQLHIEREASIAYAQPGVTVEALDAAARAEGLFYPPDPGSKKYATLGGTLACNAGGLRGAKYGVTRDYVLGLEGFLPTGEFVRWGSNLRKFASGYNIRDLWIGSEGTLGVITGAILKLLPAPPARTTLLASFAHEQAALETVRAILGAHMNPSILEFLDAATVGCFRTAPAGHEAPEWLRTLLDGPLLLIEFDGHAAEVREHSIALESLLRQAGAPFRATEEATEAEELWRVRRGCSQAMFQLGNTKLNEDVVVPLEGQRPLLEFVHRLSEETGLACPTFGHAADGNFHVHIMYNAEDAGARARAEAGLQRLMEEVVRLGGAITGEHGIGLAKSPFLALQHSPEEIHLMQKLKDAFDPRGILNPGKIFEPFRVWEYPREQVRLPWDH